MLFHNTENPKKATLPESMVSLARHSKFKENRFRTKLGYSISGRLLARVRLPTTMRTEDTHPG